VLCDGQRERRWWIEEKKTRTLRVDSKNFKMIGTCDSTKNTNVLPFSKLFRDLETTKSFGSKSESVISGRNL
jgi:hypothetical protein